MAKIALISEVAARSSSPPATIRWLPSTGSWSRVNMRGTLPQRRPCMLRKSLGLSTRTTGCLDANGCSASSSAAAASPPCTGWPWPTSRCSGRNGLRRFGGSHAAEEVHARRAGAERVVRGGADRLRDDEPARPGPPQRAFLPRPEVQVEDRERRVREHVGEDVERHAQPLGDRVAVALVGDEQLQHAGGLAERGGALERLRASNGSTSQTRPSSTSACDARSSGSSTTQVTPSGCSASSLKRMSRGPYPSSRVK